MTRSLFSVQFLLSLVIGFLVASDASAAGRVFYDGWESGNTNLWSQDAPNEKCSAVTTAADGLAGTRSGSYMARCNWESDGNSAGVGTQTAMVLNDMASYTNEVMYRFWIRRDASLNGGTGPKIARFGNSATFLDLQVDNNPIDGAITGAFSGYNTSSEVWLGTYWGDISHAGDRAWHKIEVYIYEHASNGIIRLWEDDVLQKEVTGYTLTQSGFYSYTPSWTTFLMGSNWSASEGCCAHDAVNYLYWDDFEIYTDTGTGGAGSLSAGTMTQGGSDTIPPAAPTGLSVQ